MTTSYDNSTLTNKLQSQKTASNNHLALNIINNGHTKMAMKINSYRASIDSAKLINENESDSLTLKTATSSNSNLIMNELNLAGVTWSVPNIRKEFEKKIHDNITQQPTSLNSNNNNNKAKPTIIKTYVHHPLTSSGIHDSLTSTTSISSSNHFFKDSNGNPTTYI